MSALGRKQTLRTSEIFAIQCNCARNTYLLTTRIRFCSLSIAAELDGGSFSKSIANGLSVSAASYFAGTPQGKDIFGKVWASPMTALGITVGVLGQIIGEAAHAFGASDVSPSMKFGNNALQFRDNPFIFKGEGLALGNAISYGGGKNGKPTSMGVYRDPSSNLGLHEQAHTWQYQVFVPLFPLAYLMSGTPGTLDNNFEFSANEFGAGRGGWMPW